MSDIFFRDEDIEHGSVKGYRQEYKLGLDRCEACKKAYSADRLRRKHEQKAREAEADEEFEAAIAAEEDKIVNPNSPLARFAHQFIPNPVDYDNFGVLPTEESVRQMLENAESEDDEEESDILELLPELNAAQQGACAILIEKNQKLFEHLVFQQLTLMFEMDEETAADIADAPFFFGDTDFNDD